MEVGKAVLSGLQLGVDLSPPPLLELRAAIAHEGAWVV